MAKGGSTAARERRVLAADVSSSPPAGLHPVNPAGGAAEDAGRLYGKAVTGTTGGRAAVAVPGELYRADGPLLMYAALAVGHRGGLVRW